MKSGKPMDYSESFFFVYTLSRLPRFLLVINIAINFWPSVSELLCSSIININDCLWNIKNERLGGHLGEKKKTLLNKTVNGNVMIWRHVRAHLHQASKSVSVNAAMTLVAQSHWSQWSHLRMGLQPILERLHCGQYNESCVPSVIDDRSVDANWLWRLV